MKKIFTLIDFVSFSVLAQAQIIISEIYGGGGDAGSTLKNDYIILKNIGTETASLQGATLQYAPSNKNFAQYHTLPDITLSPGQSYLIQEGSGGGGTTDLPAPDFMAANIMNFDGSQSSSEGLDIDRISGRVVLAGNALQVISPNDPQIIDLVNYGSTVRFAGTGAGITPTAATSFKRMENTPSNVPDFVIAPASLVNSMSINGSTTIADVDVNYSKFNFIVNPFVKDNNDIVFGGEVQNVKVYDEFGQVVMTSPTKISHGLDLTELPKGKYTVTGMINNAPVSQKIVRD
ncbi:lamin tail domain-containing protein [Chryseobacterium sp. SSA4.19]|uniref:lamin tail domain-containing protein n=1 Tax=Chryseobacterium sp. SSA4.19 TaxID=2919915 RepID=UPI001F4D606E|nr:lamin tail domain-containing protein [Chryseobacterium sp. SSA4.19]MCJ8152181.1 lamin tail domain-containing protein [Chryseobacterium sp. SSA4.19]